MNCFLHKMFSLHLNAFEKYLYNREYLSGKNTFQTSVVDFPFFTGLCDKLNKQTPAQYRYASHFMNHNSSKLRSLFKKLLIQWTIKISV